MEPYSTGERGKQQAAVEYEHGSTAYLGKEKAK